MTLSLGWGSEIDADQNPKAAAASAQTMLITSALLIANRQFRAVPAWALASSLGTPRGPLERNDVVGVRAVATTGPAAVRGDLGLISDASSGQGRRDGVEGLGK